LPSYFNLIRAGVDIFANSEYSLDTSVNRNYLPSHLAPLQEGRIAIVTTRWARDAMDAAFPTANGFAADGEVVWSWRRDPGVYPRRPVLVGQR
jgi:hypothetical protein